MQIGLFDSGLGGLTILKSVSLSLPQYDYVFYGDTANLPLGDKSEEEIYQHTLTGIEELFARGCLIVILACNTASSETLRRLQDTFLLKKYPDRRILGVVIPTVEELIQSGSEHALLIATKRTVESKKYERELGNRADRPIKLTAMATPALVPAIEQGEVEFALNSALETLNTAPADIDAIILGCTHYTKLKDGLRQFFATKEGGGRVKIISQDEIIPAKLKDYLTRHPELQSRLTTDKSRSIVLTKHRPDYDQVAAELLGR